MDRDDFDPLDETDPDSDLYRGPGDYSECGDTNEP